MANPYNSPWNKPVIYDKFLKQRWQAIEKYLTTKPNIVERKWFIEIEGCAYIAKNTTKMRLISHLDWCHYTAKTLAQAIDAGKIAEYYEQMLKDPRSDANVWNDTDKEMDLKTEYAARVGRASKLPPPLLDLEDLGL